MHLIKLKNRIDFCPVNCFSSRIFFLVIFLLIYNSDFLFGKTYYINNTSPVASDTNSGTFEFPWETIHKANRAVVAGDTVIVMAGVYHDWISPDANGTPNNWIVYKSEPEHEAKLNGYVNLIDVIAEGSNWERDYSFNGNVWKVELISSAFSEAWKDGERMPFPFPYPCDTLEFSEGFSFVDSAKHLYVWLADGDSATAHEWNITLKSGVWFIASIGEMNKYVEVNGFVVENYGLAGISVQKNYVNIINNVSRNNGRAGIEVGFCNHVYVDDNEAYSNCVGIGFSQGITAYKVSGKDIYFRRNISHDNIDGADPEHCGSDGGGFVLDSSQPSGGAVFINNVAYNNVGSGFGIYQSDYGYFINNTSFNNGWKNQFVAECHIIGTGEQSSNNLIFRNNIFAGRTNNAYIMVIKYPYSNLPQNVVFDHNLYFQPNADSLSEIFEVTLKNPQGDIVLHLNLEEFQNLVLPADSGDIELNWGDSSLFASPELDNWQNGGFALLPESNAIDNGSSLFAPSSDFYHTSRPQGNAYDIGAFEYLESSGVEFPDEKSTLSLETFPNPFNGNIRIFYTLPKNYNVKLSIFDICGREITVLVDRKLKKGKYSVNWNARSRSNSEIASGVYLVAIRTEVQIETRKIIYLK